MASRLFGFLFLVIFGSFISAWEIEDVNGTYMYTEADINDPLVLDKKYSWGMGRRLPETSIEFDLGLNTVLMPGMGKYIIESVYKDREGSICLKLFFIGDEARKDPFNMKITFIDRQKAYIVHDQWKNFGDRRYSPEAKWVWHRLSGPVRK